MEDLDRAVALGREALRLCPQEHPDRPKHLNSLACYLSVRCSELLENVADLEEAVVLGREALGLCPEGHPSRSKSLYNLAADLHMRYRLLGEIADRDDAIALGREALDLCPRGHPDRLMRLGNLKNHLDRRYTDHQAMVDLDEAIVLGGEILDICSQGHPDRLKNLIGFAQCLYLRYQRLGAIADLENAITHRREAVNLCPRGHKNESDYLHNLAIDLAYRFNRLGTMPDLEDAIALAQKVVDLCPPGHEDRQLCLRNLAVDLFKRYNWLGETADLDNAIALTREGLDLCPQGHQDRVEYLVHLANLLSARYVELNATADLEDAIVVRHEVLDLSPPGHSERPVSLRYLAAELSRRYTHLWMMTDLDGAISFGREALELWPLYHPSRSELLDELAGYLRTRLAQSNQSEDEREFFDLYIKLKTLPEVVSSSDLFTANAWVDAAEEFHHPSTLLAYRTSLRLLVQHLATLPSLSKYDHILKQRTSLLTVDAFSACLRNGDSKEAVELLEQGWDIFWNQLSCLRSSLNEVIESGPAGKKLADEFAQLTSLAHGTIGSPDSVYWELDQFGHFNDELHKVVMNIRKLRGLEGFHLPPLFFELQLAAIGGPVIIVNASQHTCDALIIFVDRDPIHVPFQITQDRVRELSSELQMLASDSRTADVTSDLGRILRELWAEVVSPVVNVLSPNHPAHSRIWWYPTAEFTLLPLHAAGPYRTGQPNLPDLYISSYTPSLTALIRARRSDPPNSAVNGTCVLAVGAAEAAGESELGSVGGELDTVGQRIGRLATFTQIDGPESTICRISEELVKNDWFHFACHSIPNVDRPPDAAFALHDGQLTVEDIMGRELRRAEFVYLSACHTIVRDDSEESQNEVVHLPSVMQLVGFRSVVGTMWAADDAMATKVAATFYEHVKDESGRLDHARAAYALNRTMDALADSIPFDQRVLYVHVGA